MSCCYATADLCLDAFQLRVTPPEEMLAPVGVKQQGGGEEGCEWIDQANAGADPRVADAAVRDPLPRKAYLHHFSCMECLVPLRDSLVVRPPSIGSSGVLSLLLSALDMSLCGNFTISRSSQK
jgi:hypothetical protein